MNNVLPLFKTLSKEHQYLLLRYCQDIGFIKNCKILLTKKGVVLR